MTFVFTVSTSRTAWLLVDRRLSWRGRPPDDTGKKLIGVDAVDGKVLIGYCGLGKTSLGTEPSEWMARTLRGVNLPLEQMLEALCAAAERRLPRFVNEIGGYHVMIAAGFRNGEPRTYVIEVAGGRTPKVTLVWRTWKVYQEFGQRGPFFASGGSGAVALKKQRSIRSTSAIHVLRAYERGTIKPLTVARYLARWNMAAAAADTSHRVSKRCIVAYRLRDGGGGHYCFNGYELERPQDARFPVLSNGDDIGDIADVSLKHLLPIVAAHRNKRPIPEIDRAAIDADLAALPTEPDDRLE